MFTSTGLSKELYLFESDSGGSRVGIVLVGDGVRRENAQTGRCEHDHRPQSTVVASLLFSYRKTVTMGR